MDKKIKWVQIRVSVKCYNALKKYVKETGIPMAESVRRLIEEYLLKEK